MPKNRFRFSYELTQKKEKSEEAEIMIYSSIVSSKWREDDPEVTAKEFDKMLKEAADSGAKKLRLRINSPGGSVWQAVAMKTMLENRSFEELNIDIEGLCASAATFFVCVPGAHVRIAQGSEFMIHNPSSIVWGTAAEMIRTAERMQKMEKDQHKMYAQRSGQTEEQVKSWMDEETWFTAQEAVDAGFCDEVMNAAAAAACADEDALMLMQEMYQRVPEGLAVQQPDGGNEAASSADGSKSGPTEKVRTEQVDSSTEDKSTEEGTELEINQITMDQLREGNPELFQQILRDGAAQERERMQQIDALTDEGYEELAQEAKANGTSAADFLAAVIQQKAGKKKAFVAARKEETAAAEEVAGGASEDNDAESDDELAKYAKEMAEMAKGVSADGASMF